MKTEGEVREVGYRRAWAFGFATVVCIALVSLATPFLEGQYYRRWFVWPRSLPAVLRAPPASRSH
jgi:cytochrome d ubiquinol oxidase subunit II